MCTTFLDPMNYSKSGSSVQQEYWNGLPCPTPGDLLDSGKISCIDRWVLYQESHLRSHFCVCMYVCVCVCCMYNIYVFKNMNFCFSSVQFSSVTQLCLTLCDPMDCSTPGLPVHRQLLEFTQIHVHWVGDAIQPSHPLSSPSLSFNLSQHWGSFQMSQFLWHYDSTCLTKNARFLIYIHSKLW